jgi:transcriptional regulator with XRE-family HTH domain
VSNNLFSKWLNDILNERGWTHSELARRAHMSPSQVSDIIAERNEPGLKFYINVAQALKIPLVTILRVAGVLEPAPGQDASELELLELLETMRKLPPEDRYEIFNYAAYRYALVQAGLSHQRMGTVGVSLGVTFTPPKPKESTDGGE